MDQLKKAEQLEKCKNAKYLMIDPLLHDLDHYMSRFCNKIKEGPYYILFCLQSTTLQKSTENQSCC